MKQVKINTILIIILTVATATDAILRVSEMLLADRVAMTCAEILTDQKARDEFRNQLLGITETKGK